jgi:hypothetical protein
MMNIPGNLIRGAGSVVGGTMSAVASVAGRRGSSDMTSGEIVVKEKSVLTIKVIFPFSLHATVTATVIMFLGNSDQGCFNNFKSLSSHRLSHKEK